MYITVNGQRVYYQKIGEGPNVIFLHGWGNDISSFWPIVDSLKDMYTLWLIDLPGFGRSDIPRTPFFVKDYADIVASFIEKQNIKNPVVLGHSLGGRIAIKLAAYYPNLISKLILEDSAGIRPKKTIFHILALISAKVANFLIPSFWGIKEKLRHFIYTITESDYENLGDLRPTFLNIINEDLTYDLDKIKSETLILWGENDTNSSSTLDHAKKIYQLIKKSRLEIIEGAGHFPHLEQKEKFLYYVKNFI